MNLLQFILFYFASLIIVNFWIRICTTAFEMTASKKIKNKKGNTIIIYNPYTY